MTLIWNWHAGWGLVVAGFLSGAALGWRFGEPDFWGGYASFRRRLARLGHIAMVALGLLNVLLSLACEVRGWGWTPVLGASGGCAIAGGIAMPAVCFLSAWDQRFERWFFIPVLLLLSAVILFAWGGGG